MIPPRLPWVHQHVQMAPPIFLVFWGFSTAVTLVVTVATVRSVWRHFLAGDKLRQLKGLVFIPTHARLHMQILVLFPILSITSWLSLLIIRQALLLELLAYLYNMACLFWFFELLVELMGGPERALDLLRKEPPFRIYQVPPLMCWNVFARKRHFDLTDFRVTRFLLCQYAIVGPFIAVTDALNESYFDILHYVRILVTLFCMWGLVMVFKASKSLLKEYRTLQKYVVIQVTVFLVNFTSIILRHLIPGHNRVYDQSVMSEAWVHFIFSVSMLPLTLIAINAYRVEDLWLREKRVHGLDWLQTDADGGSPPLPDDDMFAREAFPGEEGKDSSNRNNNTTSCPDEVFSDTDYDDRQPPADVRSNGAMETVYAPSNYGDDRADFLSPSISPVSRNTTTPRVNHHKEREPIFLPGASHTTNADDTEGCSDCGGQEDSSSPASGATISPKRIRHRPHRDHHTHTHPRTTHPQPPQAHSQHGGHDHDTSPLNDAAASSHSSGPPRAATSCMGAGDEGPHVHGHHHHHLSGVVPSLRRILTAPERESDPHPHHHPHLHHTCVQPHSHPPLAYQHLGQGESPRNDGSSDMVCVGIPRRTLGDGDGDGEGRGGEGEV